ncbi:hypothetical protein MSG28_006717 [Choristoneura fumiferana]|uniref:Uncharacterized protein n=1 Tax=Choristoneura fumiferana TaxID=7141 RepID=A0ACC0JKT4_CHOFU|nr:hypothetical protein MSG28_006717 [Choristoneura fumiferana]
MSSGTDATGAGPAGPRPGAMTVLSRLRLCTVQRYRHNFIFSSESRPKAALSDPLVCKRVGCLNEDNRNYRWIMKIDGC